MAIESFPNLVRREFAYLVDNFGFSVQEKLYGSEPFDDGIIELSSSHAVVSVQLDRGDVLVLVGPASEPTVARVSINTVVEYLTHEQVKDAVALPEMPRGYEARIRYQITQYAAAIRQYCGPIFQEDFSDWLALSKLALKRMQEQYKHWTGKNLPGNDRLTAYVRAKSK